MFYIIMLIYFITLTSMIAVYSSKKLEWSRISLAFFLGWPIFALILIVIFGMMEEGDSGNSYPTWFGILTMFGPFIIGPFVGKKIDSIIK